MKFAGLVAMALLLPLFGIAQSVGIGTITPNSSAQLDISSSSKGILIPRLTTAQRDAVSSPANGLMIYNSTLKQYNFYNGTRWQSVSGVPKGAIVLSTNFDDTTLIKEGFKYTGYISQDFTSQSVGDSTIAAFNWYKGNTYSLSNTGAPSCSDGVSAVYTDSGLYCFGYDSIFIYSRPADKWSAKPISFTPARNFVNTAPDVRKMGNYVVFWSMTEHRGVRYNYQNSVWDTVNLTNAPGYRELYKSITTGAEMIIWGGRRVDPTFTFYEYPAEGYRYLPALNIWTVIPAPPGFQGRTEPSMAFASSGFLVWGGRRTTSVSKTALFSCSGSGSTVYSYDSSSYFTDGRFYNMNSNTWITVPASGAPAPRHNATVVFDGTNVVITGGRLGRAPQPFCFQCFPPSPILCFGLRDKDSIYKSGAKYDPTNNSWLPIPDAPRPFADADALWDNDQYMTMFIGDDTSLSFEPSADDWYINLVPTIGAGYVSSEKTGFAVNNSDFIVLSPDWFGAPAGTACWSSRRSVFNFRPLPVTIRIIKSSQIQAGTKFYLYQKE